MQYFFRTDYTHAIFTGKVMPSVTTGGSKYGRPCAYLHPYERGYLDIYWATGRMALAVDGDNMTALATIAKLKSPDGGVRRVARDIALDFADVCSPLVHCRGIAGVSHVLPDILSRMFDPTFRHGQQLPLQQLAGISPTRLAMRTEGYHRA